MTSERNEAPRRWDVVKGSGEGAMPLPRIFIWIFERKIASFGAFWELILLQPVLSTHKTVNLDFGL